jgi:uncharacterized protein (DUF2062 family)
MEEILGRVASGALVVVLFRVFDYIKVKVVQRKERRSQSKDRRS